MLTRFKLHNFRSYLNTEIEFRQRHLLIGPNNSGKTNLLLGLRLVGWTATNELPQAASGIPGGLGSMRHYGFDGNTSEFELQASIPFESEVLEFTYKLALEVVAPSGGPPSAVQMPQAQVTEERLTVRGKPFDKVAILLDSDGRQARLLHEAALLEDRDEDPIKRTMAPANATMLAKLYDLPANPRANLFKKYLASFGYLSVSPVKARWTWQEQKENPADLGWHAEHLPTMIFHLKNQDEARYRRLIERVQVLEPNLEAINFFVAPDQGVFPFLVMRGNRKVAWADLSDGTLRYLAISYATAWSTRHLDSPGWPAPLVMIEEPENGIYVGQLRELVDAFEDFGGDAQFILTTHSPYLLEQFDDDLDAVSLVIKQQDRTVITSLGTKRAQITEALDHMSLGEQYFRELFL